MKKFLKFAIVGLLSGLGLSLILLALEIFSSSLVGITLLFFGVIFLIFPTTLLFFMEDQLDSIQPVKPPVGASKRAYRYTFL